MVNEEFSVPLVIYHRPRAAHRYSSGIKFLPKVIGDVWHNGAGSIMHKSRRIGLHSGNFLKTSFNDECSIRVIDCTIRGF